MAQLGFNLNFLVQDFWYKCRDKVLLATARHCTAAAKINKTFIVNLLRSWLPLFTDFVRQTLDVSLPGFTWPPDW
jgi:hypothetical protein